LYGNGNLPVARLRTAIVGFAAGVWLLQWQPELPGWAVIVAGLAIPVVLGLAWLTAAAASPDSRSFSLRIRHAFAAILLLAAVFGFSWAAAVAQWRLADRLDPGWEGIDVTLTGVIAGLPQPFERGVRFEFDVESVQPAAAIVPQRVSIAWYNGLTPEEYQVVMPVRAGERWRLAVRLRLPHGLANPHGFDYEAWLLERGIRATGFVRVRGGSERLDALVMRPAYLIERLRERIRDRFQDALEGAPYAGILIALAIGDQRAIEPDDWQVFARTGVSHLMSISGLHVTMVSGLFAWLVFNVWRRVPRLALRLPAQKAAALAAIAGALAYCLISGFAVPAQRTLYMVSVVALALWLDRASSGSRVLAWALAAVLVLDPWAVLAAGFWLSFGAVALIFYLGACRPERRGWLAQWAAVQWAVTLGLAPLTLVIFQQVSLVSPLANAVAIPLVSLVVTPLALAGAVLPFDFPLHLAHWLLEWLLPLLEFLAGLEGAVWTQHAPAEWTLPPAMLGACWLLAPRGTPARVLGVTLLLPMFAVMPASPGDGELWLTFFDVGQGMAVAARTRRHVLLYDAGPSWGEQSDSGARVVLPFLRGEGVSAIDMLVVSHDDSDHSGGALSILNALPVAHLSSSLGAGNPLNQRAVAPHAYRSVCAAGQRWQWDGVRFEFLHPSAALLGNPFLSGNDGSCVLRIETASGSVSLAGDMERAAEQALLSNQRERLKTDVLLVPHHGSGTSSGAEFVAAAAPAHAVFQVGYRNRFGHPRADVLRRYAGQGSDILRTDAHGAIGMRFAEGTISVEKRREVSRRYWMN
jgi:competence protein ComEC